MLGRAKIMDMEKFKERISRIRILGMHIERYLNLCMFVTALSILGNIALIIWWHFDPKSDGSSIDTAYYILYYVALFLNLMCLLFLILSKFKKIGSFRLAVFLHTHVLFLFAWATAMAILDLQIGTSPFIVLIMTLVIAGLLVVEPIFFTILCVISVSVILIMNGINHSSFFNGREEIADFIAYFLLVVFTSYRHYRVTITEFKAKTRLEQLTYFDDLTGLYNERSYMLTVDDINNRIEKVKGKKLDFGIVVMDVNNLKATNDKYGHRYGCHLVVKTGHVLPTVFKNSKCFHVGGDEFVVILLGEDLKNYEVLIKSFDEQFRYSLIEFDGVELIFSVARGVSIHQEGQLYRDTFNIADKAMYENKVGIKKEYNLASR